MKKAIKYLLLLVGLLIQNSCEKIIDVSVNDADRQLVVNAAICLQDTVHQVFLSQSGNYTNGDGIEPISADSVILSNPIGTTFRFTETELGTYSLSQQLTVEGTYFIEFFKDDKVVFAQSSSVAETQIDSVYFEEVEGGFGPGGGGPGGGSSQIRYELHVLFSDLPNQSNFYRVRYAKNGELQSGVFVADDDLVDGTQINYTLFRSALDLADTVQVELWSIDAASHAFYSTLADVITVNPFTSSAPYNPTSNVTNGIGVFCVYQRSTKERVAK